MRLLKKVFDKQESGSGPTLQFNPPADPFYMVDYIDYLVTVTATGTVAGAANIRPWKRASSFRAWWRSLNSSTFKQAVENVSFQSLSAEAALLRDGSLVTVDEEFPNTVTVALGANTFTSRLRLQIAPNTARRPQDFAVSCSDLGTQEFVVASNFTTPVAGALGEATITAVSIVGMAAGRYQAKRQLTPLQTWSDQAAQAPQNQERITLGGRKLASLVLSSDDGTASPVTASTFPVVKIDGTEVVDGKRLANMGSIAAFIGEQSYPQGYSVGQNAYAPAIFCPVALPDPAAQVSEYPRGQEITIDYNASTAVTGDQLFLVRSISPLTDSDIAERLGQVPEAVQRVQADPTKPLPASVEQWLPAQVG